MDHGMTLPPGTMIEDMHNLDDDPDRLQEKVDPRLQQPSTVPDEFRVLLNPIDYKILDLWSRGVATRKISKALKELGEEYATYFPVIAPVLFLSGVSLGLFPYCLLLAPASCFLRCCAILFAEV